MNNKFAGICLGVAITCLSGCATESHQALSVEKANESVYASKSVSGMHIPMAVGQFANHSDYQNGIFSDGVDRLGSQAQTILLTYLHQAGCYQILDRSNMQALKAESNISGKSQKLKGAKYIVTGDVVEFGRKTVGDEQLWGILGHGKQQIAYAKVNLNIVDVETSSIVATAEGAGEFKLSNRDVLGFGGTAGYDSTLNGKVLSLAIREAVNNLTSSVDNGIWVPELN